MTQSHSSKEIFFKTIQILLIFLTILGFLKTIFISLDIDESYAVAQAYRLAQGDRLILDLWESHQFSAFGSAIFIKIYLLIFGKTEGVVLFLRIIGILIHTGIGIWFYRELNDEFGKKFTFILVFLHLNFLPKWVQIPEFELMHYWFLLSLFLFLYAYFKKDKGNLLYPFLGGICLLGSIMCYPTMIFLYPIYILGITLLEKEKHKMSGIHTLRGGLFFTLGAGIVGMGFLGYLFTYLSLFDFKKYISYIFLDESHTLYSNEEKWGRYLEGIEKNDYHFLTYLFLAVIFVGVIRFFSKKCFQELKKEKRGEILFLMILYFIPFFMQIKYFWGILFEDKNQFFLQIRWIAFLIPGIYLGIKYYKKMQIYFFGLILPAVLTIPLVLMITNMTMEITYAKGFLGVFGSLLMLNIYLREQVPQKKGYKVEVLASFLSLFVLVGFFLCRILLIRVTGCLPITIKAPLERLQEGPAKGIYVLQQEARIWNENNHILKEQLKKGDRLLYIGAENLSYLFKDCIIAAPSTQGTAVYNEMYLYYYEEHPERLPNVIIIDKTFRTNPVYFYSKNNQIIMDWIDKNYKIVSVIETNYLKIIRQIN